HEWLPSPRFSDRGGPGRDLVDYLDGWFCLGLGDRDKMTPILQHEQFAYDFAGPATCSPKPSAPVQLGLAAEPLGPGAAVRVRARAVALASGDALRLRVVLPEGWSLAAGELERWTVPAAAGD